MIAEILEGLRQRVIQLTAENVELQRRLEQTEKSLMQINERQVVLVTDALAKAEEQRLAAEAGWAWVARLKAEREADKAAIRLAAKYMHDLEKFNGL